MVSGVSSRVCVRVRCHVQVVETVEEQYVSVTEEEQQVEAVVSAAMQGDADGNGKLCTPRLHRSLQY